MSMADDGIATLLGFSGVALLLGAFLLNLLGSLRTNGYGYPTMNFVGASLACYSSYLIDFLPFVVLEAVWALVAVVVILLKISNLDRCME